MNYSEFISEIEKFPKFKTYITGEEIDKEKFGSILERFDFVKNEDCKNEWYRKQYKNRTYIEVKERNCFHVTLGNDIQLNIQNLEYLEKLLTMYYCKINR